ncbi:unnamed protein product [Caenorhabditis sp. 36 PRJEB53466]|nr:unnamed protein product [Caenorhabditis sp. 36 PRJEB53466]
MTERMRKKAQMLLKTGKFSEAIDLYNEAAHELQRNGKLEEAIEVSQKGTVSSNDRCRVNAKFKLFEFSTSFALKNEEDDEKYTTGGVF